MKSICFLLALFAPLGVMIVSDYRTRTIHTAVLAVFAGMVVLFGLQEFSPNVFTEHVRANLLFIALLYLVLGTYIRLLRRKRYSSLFQAVGAGDLFFLPALSPLFGLREFVLFLTVSFLFSLGYYGMMKLSKSPVRTIPLVSTVGVCFMIYISMRLWLQ